MKALRTLHPPFGVLPNNRPDRYSTDPIMLVRIMFIAVGMAARLVIGRGALNTPDSSTLLPRIVNPDASTDRFILVYLFHPSLIRSNNPSKPRPLISRLRCPSSSSS